jgi:thiamine pyrophosphate-dependent acetolactate synthase large subunit-like protein
MELYMMPAADALLNTLQAWGVEYFFGCPGTTEAVILDAMVDRDQPGVVFLHDNVGLGNAVSGIHIARMAATPLVAINCIKPRSILGHGAFTAAHDHQGMVKQYTKWDWQVLKAQTLVEDLERAIRLAKSPPAG